MTCTFLLMLTDPPDQAMSVSWNQVLSNEEKMWIENATIDQKKDVKILGFKWEERSFVL